ncbi:MAG: FAD:protein FMN transferase [Thermotoga sp.]|nr:MAG: FAD:protein FMN transferase [Thermotoga sp.]
MRKKDFETFVRERRWSWILTYTFIAILILMVFFFSLKRVPGYSIKESVVFGTRVKIVVSSKLAGRIIEAILQDMRRIDRKFDPYDERSVIYRINNSNGEWVEVDNEVLFVLKKALYFAEITGGAFDPTVGVLVKLWGFNDGNYRIPSDEEIRDALKHVGYENVEISGNKVRLKNGALLDLGGIAKGYAVDRAIQIAKRYDQKATGFIDAGGDIGIIGPKFGGSDWVIGIRNPRYKENSDETIDVVYMKDGAIATSGDYERYFIKDGKRYHHIFNPKTGYPSHGIISATVIAQSCADADALATAIFNLGLDYSLMYIPRFGGQAFIVTEDSKIHRTKGFGYFEKPH